MNHSPRHPRVAVALVALGLCLMAGCDTSATGIDLPIEATVETDTLRLVNQSSVPIPYVVVDPRALILVDLDEETAPRIAVGATVRLAFTEITGYNASTERVVVHWYSEARGWQNFEVPLE